MKNESYDYCHVAELTDTGCIRSANEDWMAHFVSPNGLVAVVCDGMGGHVGGQIASHTAVDAIKRYMMVEREGTPKEQIVEAVNEACRAILERTEVEPDLTGMGATCVMLIVRDGKVYIGSVGDSRVYLIRKHTIRQLTVDQSYVQTLVDNGTLTQEQAERHPRKNEITNALGLKNMKPATVLPEPVLPEAGDCFLLCSDGLSGMVSDKDICKVVSKQRELTQQERAERLVEMAKQNGGQDNITCQIVEFAVTPGGDDKWKKMAGVILGLAALVVLGVWVLPKLFHSDSDTVSVRKQPLVDIKQIPDTVEYQLKDILLEKWHPFPYKDVSFLVLTEDRDFDGVKIQQMKYNKTVDTTVVIKPAFPVKNIEITPKEHVLASYKPYNFLNEKDSVCCELKFKGPYERDFDLTVTLHRQEQRPHTYIITIPVRVGLKPKTINDLLYLISIWHSNALRR